MKSLSFYLCVRDQPVQRRGDCRVDDRGPTQAALSVVPLAGQYVPLARLAADDFSASGLGKSLACPFMGFHFHRGFLWLIDHRIARQLFGRHNHNQTSSLHAGSILDGAGLRQLFNDGIHHGPPHFLIGHFPPAICEGDFGLIALFEERFHLPNFNFKVMFIGPWP